MKLLIILFFMTTCSWAETGVRRYAVPIENGSLHTKDVLQELLRAAGSRVELPEKLPEQPIVVNRTFTAMTLTAWNFVLRDFGVQCGLEEEALVISVDEVLVADRVNELEETICGLFGIERQQGTLHAMTPDSSGPVVVLVHGLDSSRREFRGACKVLGGLGYDVYFFEYPNDDRIQRNAERLSKHLRALPEDRRRDISVVTISMGGLITQTMLEQDALWVPGVKRFIACVPPFKGSKLAKFRSVNEVGDFFETILNKGKVESPLMDGMGLAGLDLTPGSLHLQRLAEGSRRPGVMYSILAGDRGMIPAGVLKSMAKEVRENESKFAVTKTLQALWLEQLEDLLSFTDGRGDGAVALESAVLEGVEDREVYHFHHLQFLTGPGEVPEDIPALPEVIQRLPAVNFPDTNN